MKNLKLGPIVSLARATACGLALIVAGEIMLKPERASAQVFVSKSCSNCGRLVPLSSQRYQNCPYCGAYWADERARFQQHEVPSSPVPSPEASTRSPQASQPRRTSLALSPCANEVWPVFYKPATGANRLFVENNTGNEMWLGLRSDSGDADVWLKAGGAANLSLGPGTYQVYSCIYPDGQATLLKGGVFSVLDNPGAVVTLSLWKAKAPPPGSVSFATADEGAEFYFTNDPQRRNRWVKRANCMAYNLTNGNTARIPDDVPVFVQSKPLVSVGTGSL